MSTTNSIESINWKAAITQTYNEVFQTAHQVLPQLLMAVLVLLAGLLTAILLRFIVHRLIFSFDWLFNLVMDEAKHDRNQLRNNYAKIASRLTFWVVLFAFITAAAKVLGWGLFAGWMLRLIDYLPQLLTGVLIIWAAFIFRGLIGSAVTRLFSSIHAENSEALGQIAQIIFVAAAVVIGVEQLGVDVSFLSTLFVVVVGVLLLGMSLAFALGARSFVANMIGAQSLHKHFRVGDYLQIGNTSGAVVEITQTSVIVDGKQGRITVPAKLLLEQVSLSSPEDPADNSLLGGLFQKKGGGDESR